MTSDSFADLAKLLADPDENVRATAIRSLREFGRLAKTEKELVLASHNPDLTVRHAAICALSQFKPMTSNVVSVYCRLLKDDVLFIRKLAAFALKHDRAASKEAVGALVDALCDEDASVRKMLIGALSQIMDDEPSIVPAIVSALTDRDFEVQQEAVRAIDRLKDLPPGTPEILVNLFRVKTTSFQDELLGILSKRGENSAEVSRVLVNALVNENSEVRHKASETLARIGLKAVPSMIDVLMEEENAAHEATINLLAIWCDCYRFNGVKEILQAAIQCSSGKPRERLIDVLTRRMA